MYVVKIFILSVNTGPHRSTVVGVLYSPFHVLTSLSEKHVNGDEMFCLFQTALSIFFQEAAITSSPQGPGTHFGQVRQFAHYSPCA